MHLELIKPYEDLVSRPLKDVVADLESYAALLAKWQKVQNLVSRETLTSLWTRHFVDSLQVLRYVGAEDRTFLDLGSGGGFPALPLAIASKNSHRQFTLVEPTSRKVSFLRTVARELDLRVNVVGSRSDQIDSRETLRTHIITSRALAAMPTLCTWMHPFYGPGTRALLHKGREHVEELKEADAHWRYDVLIHPSETDPGGVILEVTNLRGKS